MVLGVLYIGPETSMGKGKRESRWWEQEYGASSAARHTVSGDAVGSLGHGQLARGQQLGNWLLAPPGR